MFRLQRPTADEIERFLAAQENVPFSYQHVGATWGRLPRSYAVDHRRQYLGQGAETFAIAKEAIRRWRMYPRDVVQLAPHAPPIEVGQVVAPQVRLAGVWAITACRIVYVVDEHDAAAGVTRFGFAYGTLAGHPEAGEERFLVEHRQADDTVWYDLLAFSRPAHVLSLLVYPWVRVMQKRFGRRSAAAMAEEVGRKAEGWRGRTARSGSPRKRKKRGERKAGVERGES